MIDPRLLREHPDLIRAAQAKRGLSAAVVDEALAADEARRAAIADFERLRAEQKQLGKRIPQAQGDEKAAIGVAEVTKEFYRDPRGRYPALVVVDLKAVGRLPRPVTLAEMKAHPAFKDSLIARQGRLSVVPLTAYAWLT